MKNQFSLWAQKGPEFVRLGGMHRKVKGLSGLKHNYDSLSDIIDIMYEVFDKLPDCTIVAMTNKPGIVYLSMLHPNNTNKHYPANQMVVFVN